VKFEKAQRSRAQARARISLTGPAGAGKTFTALRMARGFGQQIAVIDTERGSAAKYADLFDFDVLELEECSPVNYVKAIRLAERGGFDVIVLDSLSHAWSGRGGALELVDQAQRRYRGNTFAAWKDVTPLHNALVEALTACKSHLICTMRAKTEYVLQEDQRGRQVPVKVGLAPVQRDGIEYEFDISGHLDHEHNMRITKTRCPELDGQVFHKPGEDIAALILRWLGQAPSLRVVEG
jgi:hypothetical protein